MSGYLSGRLLGTSKICPHSRYCADIYRGSAPPPNPREPLPSSHRGAAHCTTPSEVSIRWSPCVYGGVDWRWGSLSHMANLKTDMSLSLRIVVGRSCSRRGGVVLNAVFQKDSFCTDFFPSTLYRKCIKFAP